MLIATDNYNEVIAEEANRNEKYYCKHCGYDVILKRGMVKIAHFAHKPESRCIMSEPESKEHKEMKLFVYNYFKNKGLNAEMEVKIGNRIADVLVSNKYVFECQVSPISVEEVYSRNKEYNKHGKYVSWILYRNISDDDEIRTSETERYLHKLFYGRLYYYNGKLSVVKLKTAHRIMYTLEGIPYKKYRKTLKWVDLTELDYMRLKPTTNYRENTEVLCID